MERLRVADAPNDPTWAPFDATLIGAVDELHENSCLGDATWAALTERYDERQLIEVPMVVGHYHLLAFTLNSLGIQVEEARGGVTAEATGDLRNGPCWWWGPARRRRDEPDAPMGNGRAISVLAARAGAHVVCVDRDAAAAEQTAMLVRGEGTDATVVVGDVTSADDCAAMVARAAEAGGGRLDGVVVNVGIGRGAGLAGTSPEDWDATLATNLRGHFLVARAALEALGDDGAGGGGSSIVFIGSVAGLQPGSRLPAYDASKAGLIGLARHVALEGARRGACAPTWWHRGSSIRRWGGWPRGAVRPGRAPRSRWAARAPLGRSAPSSCSSCPTRPAMSPGQVLAVDGGLSLI